MSHVWSPSESIEIGTLPVDGSERIDNEIDSGVRIEIPNSVRIRGSSRRKEHDRLHQEAMIAHQQLHQEALAQHQKLYSNSVAPRLTQMVRSISLHSWKSPLQLVHNKKLSILSWYPILGLCSPVSSQPSEGCPPLSAL